MDSDKGITVQQIFERILFIGGFRIERLLSCSIAGCILVICHETLILLTRINIDFEHFRARARL